MERNELKRKILVASQGILSNLTDLLLWYFFFVTAPSPFGKTSRAAWEMARKADEAVKEINYDSFKNAIYHLKRKGLLKLIKEELVLKPLITQEGRKRLASLIPSYNSVRSWDGRIYTVAYDIPEKDKRGRDLLREFLKRLGAGKLQESLYLVFYNPKKLIKDFSQEHQISGWILVSDLGKDGTIGEGSLEDLIMRIYKLTDLNQRYKDFIEKFGTSAQKSISPGQVSFEFLSILRDDPQLPFEVLPNWWEGEKAHKLFRKLTKTVK